MSDWQKTTVGKVATGFLSGGTPTTSRADFWKGEIPWITSKWLSDKLELTTGEKFVSEEAVKKSATKIVPKDSIIFATRVGVGKVGINRIDLAINQDLAGVLIDNENYDIKFLAYQLGIDSIQQYVAMNKRGATIKGITRDCLEEIRLNIPSLPEQKKIVHILSMVQRAIEAQERIIQSTTELKKALMHKLFTEGLHNEPQKHTEIGPIPESWETSYLGEVAEIRYGLGQPPQQAADGVPMIRATNIKRGRISEHGLIRIKRNAIPESRNPYLRAGDVVVVRSGAYTGDVAMITEEWAGSVAGYDLIVSPGNSVNSAFCAYALLSAPVQQHFKGQSNRAAQAHLNRQQLQTTHIPLPSRNEQDRVAEVLDAAQMKIDYAEQRRAALQDLFRTLLHELMTAKTGVHELELEKEEVA